MVPIWVVPSYLLNLSSVDRIPMPPLLLNSSKIGSSGGFVPGLDVKTKPKANRFH